MQRFKKWDIGDILEVRGTVFKTRRGEISIHATALRLLTKSLLPLPEKFHGLRDTDTRYRRRYLDLIVNPDVKDTFIKRSLIIREIRNYLDSKDFIEVETPILVQNAGGAAARPFVTHHNALNEDLNLRISLELYLKRLIVGGLERVYEMGRVFRNEGLDVRHNPEFTLLEIYQAYTDFHGMMDLVEELYRTVALKVLGTAVVTYDGVEIDLSKPFARMTMVEAVKKYAASDSLRSILKLPVRSLRSAASNLKRDTRRATCSTSSSRNMLRTSSFSRPSSRSTRSRFPRLQRESQTIRTTRSVSSCS